MMRMGLAIFVVLGLAAGSLAQTETPVENRYLNRLINGKQRLEERLEEKATTDFPKTALDQMRRGVKRYEYQIEAAKELIAAGEEFGKAEYSKVIEELNRENQADASRSRNEVAETFRRQREENDRKFRREMEQASRQHEKSVSEANQQFQQQLSASNLLLRFKQNAGRIGLVLWNLPLDGQLHDRQTTFVGIRLLRGKETVWRAKSIRLNKDRVDTLVALPNVVFNKVVIDILKWKGEGGGLAEVEVYVGDRNVALRRPCEVTNSETLPAHLDDDHAFTDGIQRPTENGKGYWIPEARAKATVMIDLLGKPVKFEGD